jgi:thioredoxin-like negative regulator of GroEL
MTCVNRLPFAALLLSVLVCPPAVCRGQEVQWRYDYNAARREALETGRPLLLDFGTANCFWCRKLDATTFRDPGVVAALNERFIPLKVDAGRDGPLANALGVQAFPTLVFAAPDGRLLGSHPGFVDVAPLHEMLVRVLGTVGNPARTRRAQELLAQAREAYRTRHFLACLDQCADLASNYADLPEGAEAVQLTAAIKGNPDCLKQTCDRLGEQLGALYLELAEAWLKRGQPQQAAPYLERVVQLLPGSRQAETAQARLAQISVRPTQANNRPD